MARSQKLTMYRGDTHTWNVVATETDGGPLNLTGYASIKFTVKEKVDADTLFQRTVGSGITVTDAQNGTLTITTAPANTSALTGNAPLLQWDLQLTDALGNVQTLARGTLRVLADITTS